MKYGLAKTDKMIYWGFGSTLVITAIVCVIIYFKIREKPLGEKFSDDNYINFTNTEAWKTHLNDMSKDLNIPNFFFFIFS